MAISNCFQWIVCVTLVLSANGGGYGRGSRTELLLYSEGEEGSPPYHDGVSRNFYEQWRTSENENARTFAERSDDNVEQPEERRISAERTRVNARTDNGTFKIMNISPTSTKRVSKDDAILATLRDSIVFPEPAGHAPSTAEPAPSPVPARRKFAPLVTDACKEGETLCLGVANYPEDYIASILSNSADDLRRQLTVDELEPVKIAQRIGDEPDEIELCSYRERVVQPQAALNKDSKWLMVINQQNYKQGFRVEVCEENSGCHPAATFRLGMEAYCKQKYVLRKMAAVDEYGQIVMDSFRLPSCCSCVVRYNDPFNPGRKRRAAAKLEP